ncbi:MAG: hypothetical protein JWN40_2006 [Phycisphaerales bacterium]|nr:hypothetical protein [Phycisphaerales bacterium]
MPVVPPLADSALDVWNKHFAARLAASPLEFGVTPADAAAMVAAADQYAARLALCNDPATRTRIAIADKDVAKANCKSVARQILRTLNANPALTPGQRADLRMNPRPERRSPIAAPTTRPRLQLSPGSASVSVFDETTPHTRAKPPGARGAIISMRIGAAGDAPPQSAADAHLAAVATRGKARLPIPPGNRGKTLWVIAQWFNDRGELGPVSQAVSMDIAA